MAEPQGSSEAERAKALINAGADYGGAASGAALGLIGGPAAAVGGAVGGVAITRALRRIGAALYDRLLSSAQRGRVGIAYEVAASRIAERLDNGEEPRADGFFDEAPHRSSAEELLEGVLLAAADSYEERKVPFLGNLYASLAFDRSVDRATANYLIRTARDLTFRQLVTMAVLWEGAPAPAVAEAAAREPAQDVFPGEELGLELDALERVGLAGRGEPGGTHRLGGATFANLGALPIGSMSLTAQGKRLYELMNLSEVPGDARREVLDQLTVTRRAP